MIESPWLKEVLEESRAEMAHHYIVDVLSARFVNVPDEVRTRLLKITDPDQLRELNRWAACCSDLDAFRDRFQT